MLAYHRVQASRPAIGTFQITLPEELLQKAEAAGLLSPEAFEQLIREKLKAKVIASLKDAMARIDAVNDLPPMSAEEIAEMMRAEQQEHTALCA
jgi:lipoate-protein ligase A